MIRIVVMLLCALLAVPSFAHKPSDAYLTLDRDGVALSGQWDIALRDLDNALSLDANGDGEITWGEVRAKHAEIAAYALNRLQIVSGGSACPIAVTSHAIDAHTDGAYAVLKLAGRCAQSGPTLTLDYRLFFDIDPQHRGLLNLVENRESTSIVFSAENSHHVVGGNATTPLIQLANYLDEGIWHIWLGFDHILFLVSLLLPAVLVRRNSKWRPAQSFRAVFV